MKRMYLLCVFAVVSSNLIGQNEIVNLLNKWSSTHDSIVSIYQLINCDKGGQDALLKEAHDSLVNCDKYMKQVLSIDRGYQSEVNYRFLKSYLGFHLFSHFSCASSIFTKNEIVSWVRTFESYVPEVKRMLKSDLKYKYEKLPQSELDELQYDVYWETYAFYKSVKDTVGISKSMHRYIELLRKKYTNSLTFCNDICRDTTMKLEKSRLDVLFKDTKPDMWGEHKLDYQVLEIELMAEEKQESRSSIKDDFLSPVEKMLLTTKLLILDLNLDENKPDSVLKYFNELTRLKEATKILGRNDYYQRYYTALVKSSRASDKDRLEYLDSMKYLSQASVLEPIFTLSIHADMKAVSNLLFDSYNNYWEYNGDSFKQLQAYYEEAEDKEGVQKCLDKLADIEKARLKKEKRERFDRNWGLSVGFEPFKTLFNGGKQLCFNADITAFGQSQSIRYCKFDGITDNDRFYTFLKKNDHPGGSYRFSGYEASYLIPLLTLGRDFIWEEFNLEYRYGNYEFEPLTNATLLNRTSGGTDLSGQTVDPVGVTNDVSLNCTVGFRVTRRVFLEAYVGVGLGYRKLKADQDLKQYRIDDAAYGDERWNKWTRPGRLGFKCSLNLF